MALSKQAIRAIAIRRAIARRKQEAAGLGPEPLPTAANENNRRRTFSKGLLAACIDAGGFDQNERYA